MSNNNTTAGIIAVATGVASMIGHYCYAKWRPRTKCTKPIKKSDIWWTGIINMATAMSLATMCTSDNPVTSEDIFVTGLWATGAVTVNAIMLEGDENCIYV